MLNFDQVNLTQTTRAFVVSVTRYKMEDNSGCNILWVQAANPDAENRIGWEVMKSSAELDLYPIVKSLDDGNWPKLMELDYIHRTLGGGKAGFHIVDVRLVEEKPAKSSSPAGSSNNHTSKDHQKG